MIGLRENGKPIIQYDGDGMIIETGWNKKPNGDFEIEFKGQHRPAGVPFKLGDTNFQDSVVVGTLSQNATNDELMMANLTIDSKVPVEIQFPGISDITASTTNDAAFNFEAGRHALQFNGKINAVFDNKL